MEINNRFYRKDADDRDVLFQLNSLGEIVGTLADVKVIDGRIIVVFSMVKSLDIPLDNELIKHLKQHMGMKIGLINIDGEYRIRKIAATSDNNIEQGKGRTS